jgi:hypothetical protein
MSAQGHREVSRIVLTLVVGVAVGWGSGRSATAPAAADGADRFFAPDAIQTVHLEIAPVDLERMQRALPSRIHVPGTFRWNDPTVREVGIRYQDECCCGSLHSFRLGVTATFLSRRQERSR